MAHCCVERKYMFQIKKCMSLTCNICKPPCLPPEMFELLKYFPDPMPGQEGHYKAFSKVFGTETTGKYLPSSVKKVQRWRMLPSASNLQHVQNVAMMLQCKECDFLRLLYAQRKLTCLEWKLLEQALADYSFTCEAPLQYLDLPGRLVKVNVRDMSFGEPIEKLYYSVKYPPICIYCAIPVDMNPGEDHYPQCQDCDKPHIKTEKLTLLCVPYDVYFLFVVQMFLYW